LTDGDEFVFLGFGASLYFLFVARELKVPALLLGALISVGGVCNLVGALAVERLAHRFGLGRTLIASALLPGFAMLLVPMAHGSLALCITFLTAAQMGDLAWPVYNIAYRSLRQSITPGHLLGRVNSALHVAYQGVMPLGALAGGAIAQHFGVRPTLFPAAFGFSLATLWLFFSPLRLRELPTDC
jgi:predicted MFS family arabinose efflux permease